MQQEGHVTCFPQGEGRGGAPSPEGLKAAGRCGCGVSRDVHHEMEQMATPHRGGGLWLWGTSRVRDALGVNREREMLLGGVSTCKPEPLPPGEARSGRSRRLSPELP